MKEMINGNDDVMAILIAIGLAIIYGLVIYFTSKKDEN